MDEVSVSTTVLTMCGTRLKPQCMDSLPRMDTFRTSVVAIVVDMDGKRSRKLDPITPMGRKGSTDLFAAFYEF